MTHDDVQPISVVVTDDDISVGGAGSLLEVQAFHERFGIPVTYFITPFPQGAESGISRDEALIEAIGNVVAQGAEAQPHAYEHNLFEWGYPEISAAMELSPEACRAFADARFAIERYHAKDLMRQRLRRARDEWETATGIPQTGFRPGWGSFSGTLYELLREEGILWSSVRFASRTSWLWCFGNEDPPEDGPDGINPAVGVTPYRQNGVLEFPILGDFGFHARRATKPKLIEIFKTQFMHCVRKGAPCVIVHHPHGLASLDTDVNVGYDIYAEIFEWLQVTGLARFETMSRLYETWRDKAGPLPEQSLPRMG